MRGHDEQQESMYSYISPEKRVPSDHPLRRLRGMVDTALQEMSPQFAELYSHYGRPSIAPEKLLRALLLQVLYSVRSERAKELLSDEHFTVDGTLIQAWAGQKSFQAKKKGSQRDIPPEDRGNATVDFHGEKRSNDTHKSTTDRQARLYKKSKGTEAKLSYLGHVLAENRNGLVLQARVTMASGNFFCRSSAAAGL
jgi:transposase